MGRKYAGTGKYIYLSIALIMLSSIIGCVVPVENTKMEARTAPEDVIRWRSLRIDGSPANQTDQSPPTETQRGDEALFGAALRLADPGNPAKDYNKSIASFKKLTAEFPQSSWAYRGHIFLDILQENAKLKKQLGDLQLENAKARKQGADLQQENTKLKEIIEQSKKVDIEIEQKKRE